TIAITLSDRALSHCCILNKLVRISSKPITAKSSLAYHLGSGSTLGLGCFPIRSTERKGFRAALGGLQPPVGFAINHIQIAALQHLLRAFFLGNRIEQPNRLSVMILRVRALPG